MKTKIVYSEDHIKHFIQGHPESPDRVEYVLKTCKKNGYDILAKSQYDIEILKKTHTEDYIKKIFSIEPGEGTFIDSDTFFVEGSLKAAVSALDCAHKSIELAIDGIPSFALCRPPGHHAEKNRGCGFCIFNNAAYAANLAQKKYNIKRILIFDFDVHHGNGTENIFYDTDKVMYFSIHQHPHYPGTGEPTRVGIEKGEGYNFNIPLITASGEEQLFNEINNFKDVIQDYKPELLIFSAGFDAHRMDTLSALTFESETYYRLTQTIIDWAKPKYAPCSVLEGGYYIEYLCESVLNHLKALDEYK